MDALLILLSILFFLHLLILSLFVVMWKTEADQKLNRIIICIIENDAMSMFDGKGYFSESDVSREEE